MRLTKSIVDKIKTPKDRDQAFYRDSELKGFAIRVTSNGVKSFVLEKLVNNRVRRMTLGRYSELTVKQARTEAQKLLREIAAGFDPVAKKQFSKKHPTTLMTVFSDYKRVRKNLKPKTLYDYEKIIEKAFSDWRNKSLLIIKKEQVSKKHTELGEKNGEAYANLAMRLLRALFNFAMENYEDIYEKPLITENPVKVLSKTRAWYRVKRRKSYITPDQLSIWYQGVMELNSSVTRDYLLLILLTGLRRNEAAKLKKENVNLKAKLLTITDPKNYEPHTLPLTSYLHDLLKRCIDASPNSYAFPGGGESGYLVEPRKKMMQVIKNTGIQFTIHDLRRTFITIAERLDIAPYALKRLLNHKIDNSDVTAGYIVTDVERLRIPMEKIGGYILKQCLEQ
jgi:integrase